VPLGNGNYVGGSTTQECGAARMTAVIRSPISRRSARHPLVSAIAGAEDGFGKGFILSATITIIAS
jgi:hypothetical protein